MRRIISAFGFALELARLAPGPLDALRNLWVTLELTARHRTGRDGALRRMVVEENGSRLDLQVEDIGDVHAVAEVFVQHTYELPAHARRALPQRDEVIVDLGSHIGASAAWFSAHHPKARIVGFEPNPHSFRKLESVASRLPGVEVHEAAVTGSAGRRVLSGTPDRRMTASLVGEAGPESFEVECVTLEEGCSRAGVDHVDVLKLDIEGSELEVLRSFDRLDDVSVVMGEFHPLLAGEREELGAALPGFELEWVEQQGGDPLFVAVNKRRRFRR